MFSTGMCYRFLPEYSQSSWASTLAYWLLQERKTDAWDCQEYAGFQLFYQTMPDEIVWS